MGHHERKVIWHHLHCLFVMLMDAFHRRKVMVCMETLYINITSDNDELMEQLWLIQGWLMWVFHRAVIRHIKGKAPAHIHTDPQFNLPLFIHSTPLTHPPFLPLKLMCQRRVLWQLLSHWTHMLSWTALYCACHTSSHPSSCGLWANHFLWRQRW